MANSTSRDFDFIIGKWNILNKRLKQRFAGSNEWIEFPATHEAWKLLEGLSNADSLRVELESGVFEGASLRTYDPATRSWTIYWMDSSHFQLTEQVSGSFENGVGTFEGEELFEGKTVKLRFLWQSISKDEARWEQAYYDEVREFWETNWIMEFTRAE